MTKAEEYRAVVEDRIKALRFVLSQAPHITQQKELEAEYKLEAMALVLRELDAIDRKHEKEGG